MININGKLINVDHYPDGTPRINISVPDGHVNIEWLYEPNEEMILFYSVKHIRKYGINKSVNLYLPYIPNARMDRVKDSSEVFTLKYFCEFINSLGFENVIVRDAHSNVSLALIDRVIKEDIDFKISCLIDKLKPSIVCYPDEGASKRYSENIKHPFVFGIKKRKWEDGKIIELDIIGELPQEPFDALIIDDISSYGGTFLHTARKLKELGSGKIWLYITHCEDSILNGELIGSDLLDKIYTTKSIFKGKHDLIEVIGE